MLRCQHVGGPRLLRHSDLGLCLPFVTFGEWVDLLTRYEVSSGWLLVQSHTLVSQLVRLFRSLILEPRDKVLIAALSRTVERRDLVPADPVYVCTFPGEILRSLQVTATAGVPERGIDLVAPWPRFLFEVSGQTVQLGRVPPTP